MYTGQSYLNLYVSMLGNPLIPKVETPTQKSKGPTKGLKSSRAVEPEPQEDISTTLAPKMELVTLFNGSILSKTEWLDGKILEPQCLPIDLYDSINKALLITNPLIFILRSEVSRENADDEDPLICPENYCGGNVDLLPLVLGADEVFVKLPLVLKANGKQSFNMVIVHVIVAEKRTEKPDECLLFISLISVKCLPASKESLAYVAALALDGLLKPIPLNFGITSSTSTAKKLLWASASKGGEIANSTYFIPDEDIYIPEEFQTLPNDTCQEGAAYWNAFHRILPDVDKLRDRLTAPFLIEVAGFTKTGVLRSRYMAFIDAKALLEPGVTSVLLTAKLKTFSSVHLYDLYETDREAEDNDISERKPVFLLDLPIASGKPTGSGKSGSAKPGSGKNSAHSVTADIIADEWGHSSYIVLSISVAAPLVPMCSLLVLQESLGFNPPECELPPSDKIQKTPPPEDTRVDVRKIRVEEGALTVHKEISFLACNGAVPMNQSIKRNAANNLTLRVRTMLNQFRPNKCSKIYWQETVTCQHSAARRAVTASFNPQPPPVRMDPAYSVARNMMMGDIRIAEKIIDYNLKYADGHPRPYLAKALRCIENENDDEAMHFIELGLKCQMNNKYLLWLYAGLNFNKDEESVRRANNALSISQIYVHLMDGVPNAIGFAAQHTLCHYNSNLYGAFISATRMRKSYELGHEWEMFYERWIKTSGEEELLWCPQLIPSDSPLLIASTFFLCLRCYNFSAQLLKCFETGCDGRGSRRPIHTKITPEFYYLEIVALLLKKKENAALDLTNNTIKKLGPYPILSQIRAVCLLQIFGWNKQCSEALKEAERFGAKYIPTVLLRASVNTITSDPETALQRAAHAHKMAPSAQSAKLIARIYWQMGNDSYAERWAAAAINVQPYLADAWALLTLLALKERQVDRATAFLRYARKAGSICDELEYELNKMMELEQLYI